MIWTCDFLVHADIWNSYEVIWGSSEVFLSILRWFFAFWGLSKKWFQPFWCLKHGANLDSSFDVIVQSQCNS